MRVIITGGTGLIGQELVTALKDKYEVVVLSRNPSKYTFPAGVKGVKWDAKTAENWGHLADGAYAIINLAGANVAGEGMLPTRWTPERKALIRDSRLNAGKGVVAAVEAAATKPKVLLQSSAVGYYGHRGDEVVTESTPPGNDFLAKVCVDWEMSTIIVEQMGVRRVILRTGVVLSDEGGALPSMALPFKLFAGGPIGGGDQWMPWIHIEDEVKAICHLMEDETATGAYNLSAPNPVTNKEMGQAVGKALNRPALMPTPGFAMRLLFGEVASVLLTGQRVVPDKLSKADFPFRYTTAQAAVMDLLD